MNLSEQLLLKLIRSAVLQKNEDFSDFSDFEDWNGLLLLCSKHNVVGMVYDKIIEVFKDKIPEPLALRLKHITFNEMSFQMARTQSFKTMYKELLKDNFNPIVLKGEVLRNLYPQPESRTSLDEDLLVAKSDYDRLTKKLLSLGFEEANESEDDKHWVNKKLSVYFEIHFTPFSDTKSYKKWNAVFDNWEQRIIKSNDIISLSREDNLIFLLLHSAKHFIYSGVGLKQILDIALFMKKYQNDMDFSYITAALKSTNTLKFVNAVTAFIKEYIFEEVYCFSKGKPDEGFIKDVMNGGSLGQGDEERRHSANVTASAFKGNSRFKEIIFPPRERIYLKYPFSRKYPILIPLAWLMRLASFLVSGKKMSSLKTGNERLRMLKKYGLINKEPVSDSTDRKTKQ